MSREDAPQDGQDSQEIDRRAWWAGLTDDALADETRSNRRSERWLLAAFVLAAAVTLLVLVAHPGPLLP